VKRVLNVAIVASSLLLAGGDTMPIVEPLSPVVEAVHNKSWFVGINGGYIGLDATQNPANAIATNFVPEYEGISYGVEIGHDSGEPVGNWVKVKANSANCHFSSN